MAQATAPVLDSTMDRHPGGFLARFIEQPQRLAQPDVGSFCFHPLHPPRLNFTYRRKLLIQLPDLQR